MSAANASWQKSVEGFLAWWLAELRAMLPASLGNRVRARQRLLVISVGDSEAVLSSVQDRERRELIRVPRGEGEAGPVGREAVAAALARMDPETTRVVMEIPRRRVLTREVRLPPAASENLREVLGFEMHRLTPYRAEDVHFEFRELARGGPDTPLRVELSVTPRAAVQEVVELTASWNLVVAGVFPAERVDSTDYCLSLAPGKPPSRVARVLRRWVWAANAALLVAALIIPLVQQEAVLEALRGRMQEAKVAAEESSALRGRVEQLREDRRALVDRKRDAYLSIEVLDELTQILPDSTWLHRFEYRGGEVQVQGTSDAASSLIALIEDSDMFRSVSFRSPVTQNAATGEERFHLAFRVVPKTELGGS